MRWGACCVMRDWQSVSDLVAERDFKIGGRRPWSLGEVGVGFRGVSWIQGEVKHCVSGACAKSVGWRSR